MRRLAAAVVLVVGTFASPAAADDETRRDRQCRNQCANDPGRDCRGSEDCSSFSPSFEDSPVRDSFNPTLCVLPDSCHFDGDGDEAARP